VKKPEPVPGLVIRYDFLWKNELGRGRIEGVKVRPCAVVIVVRGADGKAGPVIVAPVTHAPPHSTSDAIEIPTAIKRHLGLDEQRSWIVVNEVNRVSWDDAGIEPVSRTKWVYGALPQSFLKQVQERIDALAQTRKVSLVDREKL
jgi:uncharacterized protein YifN (PemK superfamily)